MGMSGMRNSEPKKERKQKVKVLKIQRIEERIIDRKIPEWT